MEWLEEDAEPIVRLFETQERAFQAREVAAVDENRPVEAVIRLTRRSGRARLTYRYQAVEVWPPLAGLVVALD